jgi:hypothetical protein
VLLGYLADQGLDVEGELPDLDAVEFVGSDILLNSAAVREILENPLTKDQIDEILDKADAVNDGARVEVEPASTATNRTHPALLTDTNLPQDTVRIIVHRAAINMLSVLARNCDHEMAESKRKLTRNLTRLWSAHALDFASWFNKLVDEWKSTIGSGVTADVYNRLQNVLRIAIVRVVVSRAAQVLASESLKPFLKEIADDETLPEGERLVAALVFAETWDSAGISLVRDVLRVTKNKVLEQAALRKMLDDYRLQRYRVSSRERLVELIAETEILMGLPKSAKGARMASLRQQNSE